MASPNPDLHGNAPDSCRVAMLLVDVFNPLDFTEADQLLAFARRAAVRCLTQPPRCRGGEADFRP